MSFTRQQILDLYKSEATRHRDLGTSSIQDIRTRSLEAETLLSYLRDGQAVLEVGCGNGYTAQFLAERLAITLTAIDLSPEMIGIARERNIEHAHGSVTFLCEDVLSLHATERYDVVFTERCLQNLPSWAEQRTALTNIARALRSGGHFLMIESFWTGLRQLNAARRELDLPEISPPWHNLLFEEEETIAHLGQCGCFYVDQNCFLSGYYFGSRVLYPALLPRDKNASSSSVLNDYFCHLPPHGDFCPMKLLHFQKQ